MFFLRFSLWKGVGANGQGRSKSREDWAGTFPPAIFLEWGTILFGRTCPSEGGHVVGPGGRKAFCGRSGFPPVSSPFQSPSPGYELLASRSSGSSLANRLVRELKEAEQWQWRRNRRVWHPTIGVDGVGPLSLLQLPL
jgi:hypothetical protein